MIAEQYLSDFLLVVSAIDQETRQRSSSIVVTDENSKPYQLERHYFPNGVLADWELKSGSSLIAKKDFFGIDLPRSLTTFFDNGSPHYQETYWSNGRIREVKILRYSGRELLYEHLSARGELKEMRVEGREIYKAN